MSNKKEWFMSHLYLLGFLGFTGFLYFKYYDTIWLESFAFFGFFGWKWSIKYAKAEKDAIFMANENKAYAMGLRISATIVIFCMFLLESYFFDTLPVETKYDILVGTLCVSFALCFIVDGYLLDKYEKESRNFAQNKILSNNSNMK